jgi:hypothetical protein
MKTFCIINYCCLKVLDVNKTTYSTFDIYTYILGVKYELEKFFLNLCNLE